MSIEEVMTVILMSSESEDSEEEDSSSSSSEEEAAYTGPHARRNIPRIKFFVENVILQYNSVQFKSHFRMFPDTFEFVLSMIGKEISRSNLMGRKPINAKKQLLLTIWMMATPDSYRSVCQKFDVGQATALRSVRRVSRALYALAPKYIVWPTGQMAKKVMRDFEKHSAFPCTIGAIDGTHIQINAPNEDGASYINRKGYYSMQVQAVCTGDLLFTSVFAGNVGSVHDARVFRLSPVQNYVNNPHEYFEGDSHIIGDAAYGIHQNIMVPFKDNGHLTIRQKNFNFCLSSARMAIERAFGLWKVRWRSILHCLPMVTIEKIPEYLLALAVLHNICILRQDNIQDVETITSLRLPQRAMLTSERRQQGIIKREIIMQSLIIRNV